MGFSTETDDDVNRKLDQFGVPCGTKMLPKQIKIGAVTWPIIIRKLKGDLGVCEKAKLEIHINSDLKQAQEEMTLVHEILHAVCCAAGVGDGEKLTEEQFVSRIEYSLYTVLKENGFWPESSGKP